MGTLGEAATLTHGEKLDYMRAIVDAAGGRVPVFVGTTCLNTRDTIALTREALALGADGTMLGIPMWCAPALDVSVQFYRDVRSEERRVGKECVCPGRSRGATCL